LSRNKIIIIAVLLLTIAAQSGADLPLSRATAARPLALGNAYAGLADDGAAIFINAAGLAGIQSPKLTSMYNQLDEDSIFTALGGAMPLRFGGTLGVGYRNRTISNVQVSSEVVSTTDQEILLCYSRRVEEKLSAGIALRFFNASASRDVPGYSASSASVADVSLKYDYLPWWRVGMVVQNLGGVQTFADGTSQPVTQVVRIGNAFLLQDGLNLALDVRKEEEAPFSIHAGVEWQVLQALAVRLGLDQTKKDSKENYNHVTAGLGLNVYGVTIDYAWYRQGDPTEAVTHYFSLGYVGQEAPPAQAQEAIEGRAFPSPTPKPAVATTARRVVFSDLPAGDPAKDAAELLATAGLLYGYEDGTFRPKVKLTRQHFSSILLYAKNVQSDDPVKEVGGEGWALAPQKEVTRAQAAALMGIDKTIALPDDIITRGEFAVFLAETGRGSAAIKRLPPLE